MTKPTLRRFEYRKSVALRTAGFFVGLTALFASTSWGQQEIDFAHDILPVLRTKCAKCHSNGVFKGGLSLESRSKLMSSGVVEPGTHANSELYQRVASTDPDQRMPPKEEPLTPAQLESFAAWIDSGLVWPEELALNRRADARPLELRKRNFPIDSASAKHPVDRVVDDYFHSNSVSHPKPLSDRQFLRRTKLDLLGLLPTPNEIEQFESNSDSNKRDQWIDELLSRNRDYADHWMSFWNDLLRNDYAGTGYIDGGRQQITPWLHNSLMADRPYDQFVRELINPKPESAGFIQGIKWRGRVNASQIQPLQFSQNISQVFLGINMKCASCHDSFIDDWKLEDAYGLAAITAEQPLEIHRCDVPTGEIATSKFVFPSIGQIDGSSPRAKRLQQLAALMTSSKNGRFSRTIVNRLWHRMAGRGLVHPVDIMANQAWSEPLLDLLANELVENGYDLKQTLRLIATSKIYQSQTADSLESDAANRPSAAFVFRGIGAKRMTAEQLVDAIWHLTGSNPSRIDAKIHLPGSARLTGRWIWKDNADESPSGEQVSFRYTLTLDSPPATGSITTTCDNAFELFINGKPVAEGNNWQEPVTTQLREQFSQGSNTLLIRAKNQGDAPNPAALFAELLLQREPNDEIEHLGTNESWQWTTSRVDNSGFPLNKKAVDWQPAVIQPRGRELYSAAVAKLEQAVLQSLLKSGDVAATPPRASLVQSNLLMRSLGRPNREQVVTTRPDSLSTMQALDLINGEILSGWLQAGAKKWIAEKTANQWTDQQLVEQLFVRALSRRPTPGELGVLTPLEWHGDAESVEDLLWMVVMLPEFQMIK